MLYLAEGVEIASLSRVLTEIYSNYDHEAKT